MEYYFGREYHIGGWNRGKVNEAKESVESRDQSVEWHRATLTRHKHPSWHDIYHLRFAADLHCPFHRAAKGRTREVDLVDHIS